MKLSELRPCDHCGGPLPPIWYYVRVSQCMLDRKATNETLGLTQMLGSLQVAEAMGARTEDAVVILGEKIPTMWNQIFLCQDCALGMNDEAPDYNLGQLLSKIEERTEKEVESDGGT